MAKKKKDQLPAIETKDQLLTTIDDIARLEVSIRSREAKRDAALQTIRAEHDAVIEEQKARLKSLTKLAGTFSAAHRKDLFGNQKSSASALARFGFRIGNPTLKLLNNKWTWDSVLEALKKLGKYTRTIEEVDKDGLKGAKLTDTEYAEVGVRVTSGETFFVESKSDDADRITDRPEEDA